MEVNQLSTDQNISITFPIKIRYTVLEKYLCEKFVGEIISKESANGKQVKYAKILDIGLAKSEVESYNLEVKLKIQTLTFLYKNRSLDIIIQTSLILDAESQTIYFKDYKIDSQGKSWLADQLLESVLNTFFYQKVVKNLKFELSPIIKQQMDVINENLANKLETNKGIFLMGSLDNLRVSYLKAKENELWIFLYVGGWGVVDIEHLES